MKKLAIFIKNLPDASEKDKTYFMNSYLNDEIYLVAIKDNKSGFYKNKKEIFKLEYEDIRI